MNSPGEETDHLQSPTSPPESPVEARSNSLPPAVTSRTMSGPALTASMTPSSTPLGNVNAARRPAPVSTMSRGGSALNPDIAARMRAFHNERRGAPPPGRASQPSTPLQETPPTLGGVPGGGLAAGGIPSNFRVPSGMSRPTPQAFQSAPVIPGRGPTPNRGPSLAEKRGLKLPGGLPGAVPPAAGGRQKPKMSLSDIQGNGDPAQSAADAKKSESAMDRYAEFIDKETGSLKFKGKATISNKGVEFANGASFSISLDEVDTLDEMGKGNYGTVYKVRHARPRIRRPGQGLAGNKALPSQQQEPPSPTRSSGDSGSAGRGAGTGLVMAMKEIRLELDDAKFAAIIMELDILHRCISPFIVDFYGAFFQEGAVYICMEFMDGGSIDKLYGDGVPEGVLRKITYATVRGLKSLKDEHNIIHRDVKPTNVLINTRGAIKICDFGVSGNLVASIAKTNIGCQSYMAPERISSGGVASAGATPSMAATYSVQSDIWSLGLSIIEMALGRYPYPAHTYDNIFSQLSAIVDGDPPDLPEKGFSEAARNFVAGCLNKIPKLRPTYAMLLQHAWLAPLTKPDTISEEDEEEAELAEATSDLSISTTSKTSATDGEETESWIDKEVGMWVRQQLQKKKEGKLSKHKQPALHAAPLDAVGTPSPVQEKTSATYGAVAV